MNIALIAHDKKKEDIIQFSKKHAAVFSKHELFATGTTGMRIADETGLNVTRFQSGPLGGDQQIGARIADEQMQMVIFFRDPLTAQPHEPDISALLRLCDVHQIPVATNLAGAEIMVRALDHEDIQWNSIIEENRKQE
ncbi:methylglyoxal synthase [Halobacillus litoralis]|uniref:Methylglyoxal synthase n=1 Tax=Halobacillus litoralis TaxID=45668 RepID=A0A845DSR9_9BACI|nr:MULTISPECIES: methylglyoxal synthase [Halobacillus]MCA1023273.1 methylglyoxal synthase [Halobacillus litoralis]MYL19402.1 methylglyoxal synthase [Halobacillus litoralis]MYL28547.1 methylglyoxal synthase [Halobacillus halophilus]MYL38022.1 methylglyoxal synthase [Halobacillus litoralis]